MPRHIRQRNQPRAPLNEMNPSGKWIAIGGFVIGLITAAATAWVAFGTPTPYKFAELLNQKTMLTLEVDKLKSEREKIESDMNDSIKEKKRLDEQNSILSGIHDDMFRRTKEIVYQAFFHLVSLKINFVRSNSFVSIFAKGDNEYYTPFPISCNYLYEFTSNCWIASINMIEEMVKRNVHGNKINIKSIPITLENFFIDSIEKINQWDTMPKGLTYELRKRVDIYIQKNQYNLKIPLNFNLTGLNMKLKDAKKERERLLSLYGEEIYVGEKKFNGIPEAEAFKLLRYLGYDLQ